MRREGKREMEVRGPGLSGRFRDWIGWGSLARGLVGLAAWKRSVIDWFPRMALFWEGKGVSRFEKSECDTITRRAPAATGPKKPSQHAGCCLLLELLWRLLLLSAAATDALIVLAGRRGVSWGRGRGAVGAWSEYSGVR